MCYCGGSHFSQVLVLPCLTGLVADGGVKPRGESCKAIMFQLQTTQVEQIASHPKVMVHNYLLR